MHSRFPFPLFEQSLGQSNRIKFIQRSRTDFQWNYHANSKQLSNSCLDILGLSLHVNSTPKKGAHGEWEKHPHQKNESMLARSVIQAVCLFWICQEFRLGSGSGSVRVCLSSSSSFSFFSWCHCRSCCEFFPWIRMENGTQGTGKRTRVAIIIFRVCSRDEQHHHHQQNELFHFCTMFGCSFFIFWTKRRNSILSRWSNLGPYGLLLLFAFQNNDHHHRHHHYAVGGQPPKGCLLFCWNWNWPGLAASRFLRLEKLGPESCLYGTHGAHRGTIKNMQKNLFWILYTILHTSLLHSGLRFAIVVVVVVCYCFLIIRPFCTQRECLHEYKNLIRNLSFSFFGLASKSGASLSSSSSSHHIQSHFSWVF